MFEFLQRKAAIKQPVVDINSQSQATDEKHCRCSLLAKNDIVKTYDESVETCLDALYHGSKVTEGGDCIGYNDHFMGKYIWLSYNEVIWKAKYFGSGLVNIGCKPGNETFIAIYAINSVQWFIAQYGCYHYSMVVVPLYDTLGVNSCSFIVNEAKIECVIVDTQEKLHKLLNQRDEMPTLAKVICIDHDISDNIVKRANNKNVALFNFKQIEQMGKSSLQMIEPPKPSNLAMIMYTSGTTGVPKGVMLTHANFIAAASGLLLQVIPHISMKNQTLLSFLPMAHSYEQSVQTAFILGGGRIGFYSGDLKELTSDMKILKPTVLIVVPRILNKIYNKVIGEVIEGYGQTECCGPATASFPGDYSMGHVGPPLACCQVKLIDVPEMNCYADENGMGEVCIKGENVFIGYYKNSEKTSEVLDEDGWLHTGDIGMWTNGEYIAPEKIENIYCQSAYVAQCFVEGDSLK
ncbi:long-chain-fatty-acid--CoA ligase 5-like protein, partial [Dinothrombium tinctorium]